MEGLNESMSIVIIILKITAISYGAICLGVIGYGILSLFSNFTLIFKDDDPNISIPGTILGGSRYMHRTLAHDAEPISGPTAQLGGIIYIILGILMLIPLIWGTSVFHMKIVDLFNFSQQITL